MSEDPLAASMYMANLSDLTNISLDESYEEYSGPFDHPHIKAIFMTAYIAVFTTCVIGNLLVITVILAHRKMRTITNFFLANLAVADLCVGIFCVIPNLMSQMSPYWILGRAMCKLQYFVQNMSYTASIEILTVISMERYLAIIHPIRSKQMTTLCRLRFVVCVLWAVAAAYSTPYLWLYDTLGVPGQVWCMNVQGHGYNKKTNIINFVFCYIIPLILITAIYIRISVVLWRSSKADSVEKHSRLAGKIFKNKRQSKKGIMKHGINLVTIMTKNKSNRNQMYDPMTAAAVANTSSDDAGNDSSEPQKGSQAPPEILVDKDDAPEEESSESCAEDYEDNWPRNSSKREKKEKELPNSVELKENIKPITRLSTVTHASNMANGTNNAKTNDHSTTYAVRLNQRKNKGRRVNSALLARRKVIRLLIAVIVSFALCVLPYHVRMLCIYLGNPDFSFFGKIMGPTTFIILYFNSAMNPMLYAFLSDNFRRSLREVLTCKRQQRQQSMRSMTSLKTVNSTF